MSEIIPPVYIRISKPREDEAPYASNIQISTDGTFKDKTKRSVEPQNTIEKGTGENNENPHDATASGEGEPVKSQDKKLKTASSKSKLSLTIISESFSRNMLGYISSIYSLRVFSAMFSNMTFQIHISKHIPDAETIEENDDYKIYKCDPSVWANIETIIKNHRSDISFNNKLPGMYLLGLVAQYDHLIRGIVRVFLQRNPDQLKTSDHQISYSKIVSLETDAAIAGYFEDKFLESLSRKGHIEQVSQLEKLFGVKLTSDKELWEEFAEICQRRHVYAHAGGRATHSYLENTPNKFLPKGVKIGDVLPLSPSYLLKSAKLVMSIGIKLQQVVWRAKFKDRTKNADSAFIGNTYDIIVAGHYELANDLFEFSNSYFSNLEDETALICIINHANSAKLSGDIDSAEKILGQVNWKTKSPKFKISVAAILDNLDEAIRLISQYHSSDEISLESISTWPLFDNLRKENSFQKSCEEIFGRPIAPSPKEVIDNIPKIVGDLETQSAQVELAGDLPESSSTKFG